MSIRGIISTFTPNVASFGYALFLAINATGTWGGVFPFLDIGFQTHEIILWSFLAQSLMLTLACFLTTWLAYAHPTILKRTCLPYAVVSYFFGWACLVAAIYLPTYALEFSIVAGILLGLGSALLLMLWQRLFAASSPEQGTRDLIVGTVWSSVIYFSLYAIPRAITAYLIPAVFLPLTCLALILATRKIDIDQAMFEDIPFEHPQVYRTAVHEYKQAILCVSALAMCAGIMRPLAINEASIGSLVNILSMLASLAAAFALMMVWRKRDLSVNIVHAYHSAFPLIITGLLLLPFLGEGYERWFASVLYAVYKIALLLMMIHAAQAARDRGISPIFIYSLFSGVVYLFHNSGFIAGASAEAIQFMGISPLAAMVIFAIWLLSIMHFIGFGGWGREQKQGSSVNLIELVGMAAPGPTASLAFSPNPEEAGAERDDIAKDASGESRSPSFIEQNTSAYSSPAEGTIYHDLLSKRVAVVKKLYHLSEREAEVVELMARGNTVARIAEELVVSENTVRTHTKRIYTKLDIHKKQELLELLDSVRASDIGRKTQK